jgi:hypothetical protein
MVFGRCVENPNNPDAKLEMWIRHQRRATLSDVWEEPERYGPAQLHAGQEIRLDFSTRETLSLFRRLPQDLTPRWCFLSRMVEPGDLPF